MESSSVDELVKGGGWGGDKWRDIRGGGVAELMGWQIRLTVICHW